MIVTDGKRMWRIPENCLFEYDIVHEVLWVYSLSRKLILRAVGVKLDPKEVNDTVVYAKNIETWK